MMRRLAPVLLVAAACRKGDALEGGAAQVEDAGHPTDHLAPGELAEGNERAFALPLPMGMVVERRLLDLVLARGSLPYAAVEKFVAARLQGGRVERGENRSRFKDVYTSAEPARPLEVVVERKVDHVRIEVRDLTPPPPPPPQPDDEARWRAAGFKSNGEPLDPKKLR